jgi:hypothetical protein
LRAWPTYLRAFCGLAPVFRSVPRAKTGRGLLAVLAWPTAWSGWLGSYGLTVAVAWVWVWAVAWAWRVRSLARLWRTALYRRL